MEQTQKKAKKMVEGVSSQEKKNTNKTRKCVFQVEFKMFDVDAELLIGNNVIYEEWFKFIQNVYLRYIELSEYEKADAIKELIKEVLSLKDDRKDAA